MLVNMSVGVLGNVLVGALGSIFVLIGNQGKANNLIGMGMIIPLKTHQL